jgi:hypothetical protein
MLLLPEEQTGATWEPSKKQRSFENGAVLDGKVSSLVSVFERLNIYGPVAAVTHEIPAKLSFTVIGTINTPKLRKILKFENAHVINVLQI